MSKLTNDADALICVLYQSYLQARKNGKSKSEARWLGSSKHIHETLMPKWSFKDVDDTCFELGDAGLIQCESYDNFAAFNNFTDNGIIYMENRFKDSVAEVLDYLGKIKGIIPFI